MIGRLQLCYCEGREGGTRSKYRRLSLPRELESISYGRPAINIRVFRPAL